MLMVCSLAPASMMLPMQSANEILELMSSRKGVPNEMAS